MMYATCSIYERLRSGIIYTLMTSQRNIDFSDNNITLNAHVQYDETQLMAIDATIHNKVLVLTGEPGTDKTTTALDIIRAYHEAGS